MKKLRKGRPVTVNKRRLMDKPGKNYAEVMLVGDLHYGYPECILDRFQGTLDYCLDKKVYVHLMGDLLECGITGSVGDSVYKQKLNPQEQMEDVIEMLRPLAEANLITGIHSGNHEQRLFKTGGIDITKIMAGELDVPYLEAACWNIFYVGEQSYTVYTLHGRTGSRFLNTKLKVAIDISNHHPCDLVAMAHIHEIASACVERHGLSRKTKAICYKKQYIVLTGHYIGYAHSYAQGMGMFPGKVGSPKVKFFSNKHDLHSSE